jgi:lipoyl(octanoyl) transferase
MRMQESLVERRQAEEIPDQLLLLEHPPVITMGRSGSMDNVLATPAILAREGVRFFETTRGGDVTYHGPGQIVGYPIIHLGEGNRDIRKFVTKIEEVLIRTAADFGVDAERWEGHRGVWVGRQKIAAIGVRVAKWVTSHGFALNVSPKMAHFDLITPCGIRDGSVTSLEKLTGRTIPLREVHESIVRHFSVVFERDAVEEPHDVSIVKVVLHDGDRVLLLQRSPAEGGFWQPVTGTIEPGEDPARAAARELLEETGFDGTPVDSGLRQSFLIERHPGDARKNLFVDERTYHIALPEDVSIELSEEHVQYGWFTVESACDTIRWSDDRDSILHVATEAPARTAV